MENENETNNSKTIENLGTANNNVKKSYQLTSSSTLESYRNRENNFDDEELNRNLQNEERNEQIPSLEKTSRRNKRPINRFGNPVTHFIYVNYANATIPNTYNEAISCDEHREWKKAMDSEINTLNKNKTWIVINNPKDKQIIDTKWVYKRKNDNNIKLG